jgi:hypothetical protein
MAVRSLRPSCLAIWSADTPLRINARSSSSSSRVQRRLCMFQFYNSPRELQPRFPINLYSMVTLRLISSPSGPVSWRRHVGFSNISDLPARASTAALLRLRAAAMSPGLVPDRAIARSWVSSPGVHARRGRRRLSIISRRQMARGGCKEAAYPSARSRRDHLEARETQEQ